MAIEVKEVVVYIRKFLLFSLKTTQGFACRHPFVASFVFFMLLLYRCCPSFFAFLVSSSPVLFCTAILLGTLLTYGEPNFPEIEEDDKINREAFSLKVENPVDDLFAKKDESSSLEGYVDSRVGADERDVKDSAPDDENERESVYLATSSSVEEHHKIGGETIPEHWFVENREVLMKEQSEGQVRLSEVADGVSDGIEGLKVKTTTLEFDDWLDSSLGSPWQPINIIDAASDFQSDRAESTSSDASMTDILPMLDELHPLLQSEAPHALKSADNSVVDLSQLRESDDDDDDDDDSVEQEHEHKIVEKEASNEVVMWTVDDQKNVMDLGSSDLERNRRLESLMARRRARKNQIIIFEKDLIDLHSSNTTLDELSRFHRQIPLISAPRRNPFEHPYDLEESTGLPPIPGSAPSVMLKRQNPFDFPCDREDVSKDLIGGSLSQPEFALPSQRGLFFRRYDSFASHFSFPSDVIQEKQSSSRLKCYSVEERVDSEGNELSDSHRQLSGKSNTKLISASDSGAVSEAIDLEDQKELVEQEMQEDIALSVSIQDTKAAEQDRKSYEDDLIEFEPGVDQDGRFVDMNTSAVFKETAINIDAYAIDKGEIGVIEFGSPLLDVLEHKLVEEKHNELKVFASSEEIENNRDIIPHEALKTIGQITSDSKEPNESKQSAEAYVNSLISETWEFGNDQAEASIPIYDSSPSGSGTFLANISVPDDSPPPGRGCLHSTSSAEPEVQEDQMEVIPQARAPKENMTSEEAEYEMVHSTSTREEPVMISTSINLLDENVLTSMGASEIQQDINKNKLSGLKEDFGDLATLLMIERSSVSSSAKADLNDPGLEFCVGLPPSEVVEKHQSVEKLEIQTSSGIGLDESRVSNLELGPILEENSEDIKVEEESASLVKATTTCCSTGLQMLQGRNIGISSVGQELFSFHNESEEEDGDESTAESPKFLSEEAKPSENSNLISPKDDVFTGLVTQELVDIIELSNPSKVKSEPELVPNDDIKNSQDNTTKEFQINREILLKNVNEFHRKPGDVHADVGEIEVMDELLLSELDVIGDFQVDEMKSKQCIHKESQSASQSDCVLENSEFKSADFAEMSTDKPISANLNNPEETDTVLEQKKQTDTGYWSLSGAPVENPEMTVYKSGLCVLEACSLEELDSVFKQGSLGEVTEPPCSKIISEKTEEEKSHVGLSELDVASIELERIPRDTAPMALNGKAVEYITSALVEDGKDFDNSASHVALVNDNRSVMDGCKADLTAVEACKDDPTEIQSAEIKSDHVEAVMPSYVSAMVKAEVSSTELDISSKDLEMMEIDSELLVLEAKSIEDIDSAFKHVAKVTVNKSHSPLASSESIITHTVDNILEAMSAVVEKSSSLLVLEAKSVEDINSAFKQAADGILATPAFAFVHPEAMGTPPVFEDMELSTVDAGNSSELLLPEARSAEDIHLAFKLASDGLSAMSNSHVVDPKSIKTNKDLEVVEVMPPETGNDLLVPIAKFIEDIGSAFEQANDDHDRPRSLLDIEKIMTQSDLNLEKKSVDDITSSFQQSTEQAYHTKAVAIDFPVKPSSEGGLLRSTSLQSDLDHDPLKDGSFWENTNSELLVLEAESIEEINSSLKQAPEGVMDMFSPVVDSEATGISWVPDMISLGVENDPEMLSLETTPLQHRNSASEQEIEEDLAKPTSQHDSKSVNFHPDHDAVNADNKSDLFVHEEKGYEDMHMAIKEAAAHIFGQSSIMLVDPEQMGNHAGQVVDARSLDAGNNSDFSILEATSIEDLNLAFRRATEGCLAELTSKVDTEGIETHPDHDAVGENSLAADNLSELAVLEANSAGNLQSTFTDATTGVLERSLLVDPEEIENHPGHEVEDNNSSDAENDSEMLVIEAKSPDDIDAAFKQATDEPTSPLLVNASSLDTESASSLLVIEAKSVEHIDSALKQAQEEANNESTSHSDPLQLQVNPNRELIEDSWLSVLKERSVEDIDSGFKQVAEEYLDKPVTPQDVSKQSETLSEFIPERNFVSDCNIVAEQFSKEGNKKAAIPPEERSSPEGTCQEMVGSSKATIVAATSERQLDAEVEYAEEAVVAFDEAVTDKNSSCVEQNNRRTDGEVGSQDPSSIAPPVLKIQKKKSEKADSNSSSSSSSSDSE